MKHFLFSLFILTLAAFLASPAMAQKIKNSLDYTMDDGIMDEEEMMMEAQDMYKLCTRNAYQRKRFKCDCLAGAYLQQREKLGPTIMQHEIYKIITNSKEVNPNCVNTEDMAADVYKQCMGLAINDMRTELSPDNDSFCTCVANRSANQFKKAPRMAMPYIESIRMNAYEYCRDSSKRAQTSEPKSSGSLVPPKSGN